MKSNNNLTLNNPDYEKNFFRSKENVLFNINSDNWNLSISDENGRDVSFIRINFPENEAEALLRYFANLATSSSSSYVGLMLTSLRKYCLFISKSDDLIDIEGISTFGLISFFSHNLKDKDIQTALKAIVQGAMKLGYEQYFESGLNEFLSELKIGTRINLHPEHNEYSRSFTDYERKTIIYQIVRGHYSGAISNSEALFLYLLSLTGKRPKQLSDSKFKDFSLTKNHLSDYASEEIVVWNAPVIKQIGQKWRSKFNPIPLVENFGLWNILKSLRQSYINTFQVAVGLDLSYEQSLELPVFMNENSSFLQSRLQRNNSDYGLDGSLENFINSQAIHQNPGDLSKKINDHLQVFSEFTGKRMHVFPRRFRYTHATNLAISGASAHEIAFSLDHSSLREAYRYVNNMPDRAFILGEKLESTLGALARRFNKDFKGDPDKVINFYTKSEKKEVGNCGLDSICKENYPISCYECELFEPNPFGNHAAVLSHVEAKIEESKAFGDKRLVENWRTIRIAVLERIYLSNQKKLEILNEAPETLLIDAKTLSK